METWMWYAVAGITLVVAIVGPSIYRVFESKPPADQPALRYAGKILEIEELLRSAHCIAARKGENVAWDRFAASVAKLGIGNVTARTYKATSAIGHPLPTQEEVDALRGDIRFRILVRAGKAHIQVLLVDNKGEPVFSVNPVWLQQGDTMNVAGVRAILEERAG
jgi:hypothetical protein